MSFHIPLFVSNIIAKPYINVSRVDFVFQGYSFWGHYQADNPPAVTNCTLMGFGGLMVCLRGAFQFYTGGPYDLPNQRGHI